MTYYRLRDIKTPPFAYVLNRDEAINLCPDCELPFLEPRQTLEVELFDSRGPALSLCSGKLLMADLWLVGDQRCRELVQSLWPDLMVADPVTLVVTTSSAPAPRRHATPFFHFRPRHSLRLAKQLLERFPPRVCRRCHRALPEVPLDQQRFPDANEDQPAIARLEHLILEGYDYLFHERALPQIHDHFPEMMLEQLVPQPLLI